GTGLVMHLQAPSSVTGDTDYAVSTYLAEYADTHAMHWVSPVENTTLDPASAASTMAHVAVTNYTGDRVAYARLLETGTNQESLSSKLVQTMIDTGSSPTVTVFHVGEDHTLYSEYSMYQLIQIEFVPEYAPAPEKKYRLGLYDVDGVLLGASPVMQVLGEDSASLLHHIIVVTLTLVSIGGILFLVYALVSSSRKGSSGDGPLLRPKGHGYIQLDEGSSSDDE
ncbi:hypothetical protein KIPB_010906, partial [Kipferlia bialata]